MAVMLKGCNMPGFCACCTAERSEGSGGARARRSLRKSLRMRENRQWRREAEAEIREMYNYDADDDDDVVNGAVLITHYPGNIYLDPETGEFSGDADDTGYVR